jgi:hypothetical protein
VYPAVSPTVRYIRFRMPSLAPVIEVMINPMPWKIC